MRDSVKFCYTFRYRLKEQQLLLESNNYRERNIKNEALGLCSKPIQIKKQRDKERQILDRAERHDLK